MKASHLIPPPLIEKREKQKSKKCKSNCLKLWINMQYEFRRKKKRSKTLKRKKEHNVNVIQCINNMHSQTHWKERGKSSIWLAWSFFFGFLSKLGRKHFDGFREKALGPNQFFSVPFFEVPLPLKVFSLLPFSLLFFLFFFSHHP